MSSLTRSTFILVTFLLALGCLLSFQSSYTSDRNIVAEHKALVGTVTREKRRVKGIRQKHGRTLLSYHSSPWELLWLENADAWAADKSICQRLLHDQWNTTLRFLQITCTSNSTNPTPWCAMDDSFRPAYFNMETYELSTDWPENVTNFYEPHAIIPTEEYDDIFSKFIYRDDTTGDVYQEYIEPLVSHLRHPLARCVDVYDQLTVHRGYIIPPPKPVATGKSFYFDAGASTWNQGVGGPSLSVLTTMWKRHGIDFDEIYSFEGSTHPRDFYATVSEGFREKTHYKQTWVRSSMDVDGSDPDGVFLPQLICNLTSEDDYVLFKLDIDSPNVEQGQVDHLLGTDDINCVDEFIWEHHVAGNYLLAPSWGLESIQPGDDEWLPLSNSYGYFLEMRRRGIRAHSWI